MRHARSLAKMNDLQFVAKFGGILRGLREPLTGYLPTTSTERP